MVDDRGTRIAQLEAEFAALRQAHAAEVAVLAAERDVALEQQTATAEILRAIATAPADAQPVLDAMVERARRLA